MTFLADFEFHRRAVLIVVDALRDDAAQRHLGNLEGWVERGRGSRFSLRSVLPSSSRAGYEAIVTGTYPTENGVTGNDVVRRSRMASIFDQVHAVGGSSCAVAYKFFSELYIRAPYDPVQDCEHEDANHPIAHGRFYSDGEYPDSHALCEAEYLRRRYTPDFLLIHLNHTDCVGHGRGSDSVDYARQVLALDAWLAPYVADWLADGYTVCLTADHGTNALGYHGGTDPELRQIPFYVIGSDCCVPGIHPERFEQPMIAAVICRELGIEPAFSMDRGLITP